MSDAPPAGYRPADFAGDVAAAIKAAGYERFVLFGHSMGVPIALELALSQPSGLAALVLGDFRPNYVDFKADGTFTSTLEEPFAFPDWEAARATMRPSGDSEADERRWQVLRRTMLAANDDGSVRLLLDRAALLGTIEDSVTAQTDYSQRLHEIACPVLLVIATQNRHNLGPDDVDLYRGTRDLTVVSLPTDHSLGQFGDASSLHAALGELFERVDGEVGSRESANS